MACAPELEHIAEMYQDSSIGKHTEKSVAEIPKAKQQWRIVPDEGHPDWFNLEETETATVLATFVLTKDGDPAYLNRIANAPEWECILRTFYKVMAKHNEKAMPFYIAKAILERLHTPVTALLCL